MLVISPNGTYHGTYEKIKKNPQVNENSILSYYNSNLYY